MFTPGFDPTHSHKVRQEELIREAQHFRLVQEALRARPRKANLISNLIILLGQGLVIMGKGMERRYRISPQPESHLRYNPSSYKSSYR